MFLNRLNSDTKDSFLKLCIHASLANGSFEKEEKETIFAYCREMNIDEIIPEISIELDELIKQIDKETNREEKNIYILEILALVKSDGLYDDKEIAFMENLIKGFGLSLDVLDKFNILLEKYLEVGRELYTAISES